MIINRNDVIPDLYIFDENCIPEDNYKKFNIKHKECLHDDFLCFSGMIRSVKCKICHGNKKTIKNKSKIPEHKKFTPVPNLWWGTVYYIKLDENCFKIGISQNAVSGRYSVDDAYTPIWEIPCKTKGEARKIEKLILDIYEPDLCIYSDSEFTHEFAGRVECFNRDVLGNKFNINKFIERISTSFDYFSKK